MTIVRIISAACQRQMATGKNKRHDSSFFYNRELLNLMAFRVIGNNLLRSKFNINKNWNWHPLSPFKKEIYSHKMVTQLISNTFLYFVVLGFPAASIAMMLVFVCLLCQARKNEYWRIWENKRYIEEQTFFLDYTFFYSITKMQ